MRRGASGGPFDLAVVEERPGFLVLEISGDGAGTEFSGEPGGHRWQRVPPTERRGRVHTSTVTVAVMQQRIDHLQQLDMKDVEVTTTKGDGPGGQHRNKTESAVVAVHAPTGEKVRVESDRSQHKNRATALAVLAERVHARQIRATDAQEDASRRAQVGSGQRGDKIRTYRTQDNSVRDHRNGRRWALDRWMRGEW